MHPINAMTRTQFSQVSSNAKLKVLIIYSNFALAAKANALLQKIADSSATKQDWIITPWRMQLIKFPPTANEALSDAKDAQLIVFALTARQFVPSWMEYWLGRWAECRSIENAALTLISETESPVFGEAPATTLHRFCQRYDLKFFCGDLGTTDSKDQMGGPEDLSFELDGRKLVTGLDLQRIYMPRSCWGINE
jgi:hypothetical protein